METAPAIVLLSVPLALLVLLRAHAGMMFLSACAGIVLLQSVDPVLITAAGSPIPDGEAYVRIAVVAMCILIAAFLFRGRVNSIPQVILHSLIVISTGALLWLTLPSQTGLSALVTSMQSEYWIELHPYKTLIIGVGFGLSVMTLMSLSSRTQPRRKKSKDSD